jgi:hypothetical protein
LPEVSHWPEFIKRRPNQLVFMSLIINPDR